MQYFMILAKAVELLIKDISRKHNVDEDLAETSEFGLIEEQASAQTMEMVVMVGQSNYGHILPKLRQNFRADFHTVEILCFYDAFISKTEHSLSFTYLFLRILHFATELCCQHHHPGFSQAFSIFDVYIFSNPAFRD
jgi:hypothetical protein